MVLCTVIFGLALFRGEKESRRLDWLCLLLALAAIGLWITAKDPLGSVVLVTAADTIACGPTLRKSIRKPQEETASAYVMGALEMVDVPARAHGFFADYRALSGRHGI